MQTPFQHFLELWQREGLAGAAKGLIDEATSSWKTPPVPSTPQDHALLEDHPLLLADLFEFNGQAYYYFNLLKQAGIDPEPWLMQPAIAENWLTAATARGIYSAGVTKMACKYWNNKPTPDCASKLLQIREKDGTPILHWVLANEQIFSGNARLLEFADQHAACTALKDLHGNKPTVAACILLCAYNAQGLKLIPKALAQRVKPLANYHDILVTGQPTPEEILEHILQLCLQDKVNGYQQFQKCSAYLPNEEGKRLRAYARAKAPKIIDTLWADRGDASPIHSYWPETLDCTNGTRYWRIAPTTIVLVQAPRQKHHLKEAINLGNWLKHLAKIILPFSLISGKDEEFNSARHYENLAARLTPANRWFTDTVANFRTGKGPAPTFHQWLSYLANDSSNRNALVGFCEHLADHLVDHPDPATEQVLALVTENMLTHFSISMIALRRSQSEYPARWIRLAQRLSPELRPNIPLNLTTAIL